MGSQALLTIAIIAGFFLVSGIVYLVVRPRREAAGAMSEEHREQIKAQLASGQKTLPDGLIMPFAVKSSRGRQGSACYERATAAVCRIENRSPGSVISVTGTIRPADNTVVNSLYAFIAR